MILTNVNALKEDVRSHVLGFGPGIISWLFHGLDDRLKSGYGGILGAVNKMGSPLDELGDRTERVIKRLLIMIAIFLFAGFVLPVPEVNPGISSMDTTTWVGVLALEGSVALGYIAIVPWLVKTNMHSVLELLANGLRSELISFKAEEEKLSVDEFRARGEKEIDDRAAAQVMARPIVYGGLLLFGVIFFVIIGVWLSPQWKVAVLCMSVYWLWSLLQSLIIPAAFSYSDIVLRIYSVIKDSHEETKGKCSRCQMSSVTSEIPHSGYAASNVGSGKWFVRDVWLLVWGIKIEGNLSSLWTWILFFIPIYLQIVMVIIRRLRRQIRKKVLTS